MAAVTDHLSINFGRLKMGAGGAEEEEQEEQPVVYEYQLAHNSNSSSNQKIVPHDFTLTLADEPNVSFRLHKSVLAENSVYFSEILAADMTLQHLQLPFAFVWSSDIVTNYLDVIYRKHDQLLSKYIEAKNVTAAIHSIGQKSSYTDEHGQLHSTSIVAINDVTGSFRARRDSDATERDFALNNSNVYDGDVFVFNLQVLVKIFSFFDSLHTWPVLEKALCRFVRVVSVVTVVKLLLDADSVHLIELHDTCISRLKTDRFVCLNNKSSQLRELLKGATQATLLEMLLLHHE